MAEGLVSDTNLTAIANAIRAKNGSSDTYTPATMATAITNIPGTDQTTALQYMLNNKTDYAGIAAGLTTLTELPNFVQPVGITNFTYAFSGCSSLTDASDISIDTTNISVGGMFKGCSSLTTIPNFAGKSSTSDPIGCVSMFEGCSSLSATGPLGNLPYYSKNCARMFYGCSNLTSVNGGTRLNVAMAFSCKSMFEGCSNLVSLPVASNGLSGADGCDHSRMFYNCINLETIQLPSGYYISISPSTSDGMEDMFLNCSRLNLSKIIIKPLITSVNGTEMFYNCKAITSLTLSGDSSSSAVVRSIGNGKGMFYGCNSLTSISIDGALQIKLGGTATEMFKGCSILTTIPQISGNVRYGKDMFSGCSSLVNLPISFSMSAMTGTNNHQNMFYNCSSLSNNSLDTILSVLATATKLTSNKTLKYVGLSSSQATTCTTLSNWATLSAAGWTTGY